MILYIDRQNRRFVAGPTTQYPISTDVWFVGDIVPLSVQVLEPHSTFTGSWYEVIADPLSVVRVTIGNQSILSSSYFASASLSLDTDSLYYTGSFVITSSFIPEALSTNTSKECYFELAIDSGSGFRKNTIYQTPATLNTDIIK